MALTDLDPCPSGCRGHRRFVGGRMDGHIDHMAHVTPSDFPLGWHYQDGSFYERDLDGGTEALYTFAGYVPR